MNVCSLAAALLALPMLASPAHAARHSESRRPEPVAPAAAAIPDGVIRKIEFAGLRRIPPATLRAHIASREGRALEPAQVEDDVRALIGRLRLVGGCAGSGWLLLGWLGPGRPTLLAGTNGAMRSSSGIELRWQVPVLEQTVRVHYAVNFRRLGCALLLPDGSHFRPPNRRSALGWALGSLF